MGGVDCLDQQISSYMIGNRSKKWWWPVFWFCLDLSVNNAYQLYHEQKRFMVQLRENTRWIFWDFDEVLLIHITDVFENQQQQTSFLLQERCRESVMRSDMTQSITG